MSTPNRRPGRIPRFRRQLPISPAASPFRGLPAEEDSDEAARNEIARNGREIMDFLGNLDRNIAAARDLPAAPVASPAAEISPAAAAAEAAARGGQTREQFVRDYISRIASRVGIVTEDPRAAANRAYDELPANLERDGRRIAERREADRMRNQDSMRLQLAVFASPAVADSPEFERLLPVETVSKCGICKEDFLENQQFRTMKCGSNHRFHVACIDPWLRGGSRRCPLCRRDVYTGQQM